MLLSTAYSWRIEKGTVFVGKKKALVDGRVRPVAPLPALCARPPQAR